MIELDDIERIVALARQYLTERRKYERLSDKRRSASPGKQTQKASADLSWQAMELSKIDAALHAACVDAGLADLRAAETYQERELNPSGWHRFLFSPPKPRIITEGIERRPWRQRHRPTLSGTIIMTQETETVSQRAREAAAAYIRHHDFPRSQDIRIGRCDNHAAVQAFARFERELSTNKDETIAKLLDAIRQAGVAAAALASTKKEG